jgi:hypothetical protein
MSERVLRPPTIPGLFSWADIACPTCEAPARTFCRETIELDEIVHTARLGRANILGDKQRSKLADENARLRIALNRRDGMLSPLAAAALIKIRDLEEDYARFLNWLRDCDPIMGETAADEPWLDHLDGM